MEFDLISETLPATQAAKPGSAVEIVMFDQARTAGPRSETRGTQKDGAGKIRRTTRRAIRNWEPSCFQVYR